MERDTKTNLNSIRGVPLSNALLHDYIFLQSDKALEWNDLKNPKDNEELHPPSNLPEILKIGLKTLFLMNHDNYRPIEFSKKEKDGLYLCKFILSKFYLSQLSKNMDAKSIVDIQYSTINAINPLLLQPVNTSTPQWLETLAAHSRNKPKQIYPPIYPPAYNKETDHILRDLKLIDEDINFIRPPKIVEVDSLDNIKKLIFSASLPNIKNKKDSLYFLHITNKNVIAKINKNKYIKSKEINQVKRNIDQKILFKNTLTNANVRDMLKESDIKPPIYASFVIYYDGEKLVNVDKINMYISYNVADNWGNVL